MPRSRARGVDVRHGVDGRRPSAARPRTRRSTLRRGGDGSRCSRGSPRSPTAPAPRSPASRGSGTTTGRSRSSRKVWRAAPHDGIAFERFTPDGPMALLPEGDHYGLVWTATPERAQRTARARRRANSSAELARHFGPRAGGFTRVAERRTFPLVLEFAREPVARALRRCSATPRRRCIRSRGRDSTSGCATRGSSRRSSLDTPRDEIGDARCCERYSRGRRTDRMAGIAFTHGLVSLFGNDLPLVRWPRGLALTLLDALPPAKRAFTRAMLFGIALSRASTRMRASRRSKKRATSRDAQRTKKSRAHRSPRSAERL